MAENSEKSFPFDSELVNGEEDRLYFADDFAEYFRAFISSGTFMKEPTNLQVIANDDMTVTLKPGRMIIDGYRYTNTDDIIIRLDPADGVLSRIDRISATWDLKEKDIHYTIQKGIFSYDPVAPECRRNAEYKDYVVADVLIVAGAISISQSDITDQRLNQDICGLAFPFADIDTSTLNAQLQNFYTQVVSDNKLWEEEKENTWSEWFDFMKGQLTTDAALNLQKQIGIIDDLKTNTKDNLVAAVNEFYEEFQENSITLDPQGYYLVHKDDSALVQDLSTGQWCYITPGWYAGIIAFNSSWAWHQLEFNSAESKSIVESIETDTNIAYTGATGLYGETILNSEQDTYRFKGMVTRLKKKPVGEFSIILKRFLFNKERSDSNKKLLVQSWDLPENYAVSVGSASAAESAIISCDGIYTLKVYTISSNALAGIYQYVYFSDFNSAGAYIGKLTANTGTLTNTYGTIAVSTADQGVKISAVKGYRIEVTVKPFD